MLDDTWPVWNTVLVLIIIFMIPFTVLGLAFFVALRKMIKSGGVYKGKKFTIIMGDNDNVS